MRKRPEQEKKLDRIASHDASPPYARPSLAHHGSVLEAALADLETGWATEIASIAGRMVETLRHGNKLLLAGNGGSAAEAQHFAAELVGRFQRDRAPYAALALTTDSSVLTAVANDYGYEDVFVRQIAALGQPGDLLIAFSTSGESENLLRAAIAAHERRMTVVALTGNRPNRLERAADLALRAPVDDTPTVQELHMILTHFFCGVIEAELCACAAEEC